MVHVKSAFGRAGKFVAGHKKIFIALALVVIAALGFFVWKSRQNPGLPAGAAAKQNMGSFVRTVTLQKGNLDDSISASGTVGSSDVSTVTTDLKYTVKEVHVQVGDAVKEGDVLFTLDSSDLEKSIQKEKESLAEAKTKAQKTYEQAQKTLTEAQTNVTTTYDTKEDKKATRDNAKSAYEAAAAQVNGYQSTYDAANTDVLNKLNAQNAAQSAYDSALNAAIEALRNDPTYTFVDEATLKTDAEAKVTVEFAALTAAKDAYTAAGATLQAAENNLRTAKTSTNFDTLQTTYTQAQSAYEQAKTTHEQAIKTAESAETSRDDALSNYNKAGSSDNLEELQQQLEKCTLKAETSGKVTAVNATVGSAITGAAATIQDTDNLKIAITIAEYDIQDVKVGQKAIITSDVIDGEVSGTLTQISPTATGGGSSSSGFAAEVTVDGADSGLLVGTNAKVQIVLSTTEDVFTVPLDAIGEDEDGNKIIYVKTGQDESGTPTFEPMQVVVGTENDYYAEISGVGLEEGMVVRAAADESEATESGDMMMGGMMGGNVVISGDVQMAPAMPSGGGGDRPSGGPGMGG